VLVAVHFLNCCLILGVSLEADQLLIRTWCLPSERYYDNDRKAEMINKADFQIKTDSDSYKNRDISLYRQPKTTNFSGDMRHKITELTQLDLPQSEVYNSRYKIMKSAVSAGFDRFCWLSVSSITPRIHTEQC
jgi:hypothetical protein